MLYEDVQYHTRKINGNKYGTNGRKKMGRKKGKKKYRTQEVQLVFDNIRENKQVYVSSKVVCRPQQKKS